ncbi:alpha/beta hydrolase [Nocardia sp. CA-120079]|uniref:alpha/beta hydrolase n=1 Tax=Nocardia sp. CA-120079 TaxID=3239974 RepID=UPI003D96FED1
MEQDSDMSNLMWKPSAGVTIGPLPPIDPELVPALRAAKELLPDPHSENFISSLRDFAGQGRLTDGDLSRGGAFEFEEVTVPGLASDPPVSLLVCRPTATPGPYAVSYYIHGGGMICGEPRMAEITSYLERAKELQIAVVAVDYRLAPEHPYPAPVNDCYAGLRWLADNARQLNIDAGRIILGGTSAGGGLAAAVALMARDVGGPDVIGQMLLSPMLDDRCDSPSVIQGEGLDVWDRSANLVGWGALLGDHRGTTTVAQYAAPARATDLSGLPPAFIDVGGSEIYRDEAVAYASKIWLCGGQVELHVWGGGFHGFDVVASDAAISQSARSVRVPWMRRILGDVA